MNGLFIDSLMTVRDSHEAWARVVSVEKKVHPEPGPVRGDGGARVVNQA